MAVAFGQARGMPGRYEALAVEVLPDQDMKAMFSWFTQRPAYTADLDTCRRLVPGLHSLRGWLAHR